MAQFILTKEELPQTNYVVKQEYTQYTNINGKENYANIEKIDNNGIIEIKKNINGNIDYYYEDKSPVFRNDLEHPFVHFDLRKNKKYKNHITIKDKKPKSSKLSKQKNKKKNANTRKNRSSKKSSKVNKKQ